MNTVFVERGSNGAIKGVYANRQPGYAEEEMASDHADVVDFRVRIDAPAPSPDPIAKLQAFLAANPDVAALLK
jgi:hypothetical protein